MKRLLQKTQRTFGNRGIGRKNFSGNLFQRFQGLDDILRQCAGCTILDIGCGEGLISYEFARHGGRVIHGFERDRDRVRFATRLFRDVPAPSQFIQTNLAKDAFLKTYDRMVLDAYDIVLFLGVYHHLKKQMTTAALNKMVETLMDKTARWFVVRTDALPEFEHLIEARGFQLVSSCPRTDSVGLLHIYERRPTASNTSTT